MDGWTKPKGSLSVMSEDPAEVCVGVLLWCRSSLGRGCVGTRKCQLMAVRSEKNSLHGSDTLKTFIFILSAEEEVHRKATVR